MKRVHIRLDVTEDERNAVRRAAALAGFRSMAEFARTVVTREATTIDSENTTYGIRQTQDQVTQTS